MTRIALVNPLGDPGIGTYTHELAEALLDVGVHADVFTSPTAWARALPGRHRLFPVTGSALVRQRAELRAAMRSRSAPVATVNEQASASQVAGPRPAPAGRVRGGGLRETYLSVEFVLWLRARGYDMLWTQWPSVPERGVSMWTAARAAGLRVVHTAHNVFPHELTDRDHALCGHVYRSSDRIVVHSRMASDALAREFPFAATKLVIAQHGLYSTYPKSEGGRERIRKALGISPAATLGLFFGGIRPYKNVDAAIGALAADTTGAFELLVAGRESGYPDAESVPADGLGRTRALALRAGVATRVHLMPGPFGYAETSELFDAADVVLLPYHESWGSGLLLLAMSFGKPVIVTRTGGMDEHLANYPASVVLETPSADALLAAMHTTRERSRRGAILAARPPELEWPYIVRGLLPRLLGR